MRVHTLIRHFRFMMGPRLHAATRATHARQAAQLVRKALVGAAVAPMLERHASAHAVAGVGSVHGRGSGHGARQEMTDVLVVNGNVDGGRGLPR